MNKKIIAGALASVMAVAGAVSVSALETELDCNGWWAAHTSGVEITTDGVEVTFNSTSYDTIDQNWFAPLYVVYTSADGAIGEAGDEGYTEYFVCRSDLYGWIGGSNTNDGLPDGYSFDRTTEPDWDSYQDNLKAGVSGSVKATRSGDSVTVVFTVNGGTSTTVIPVDADTVYIALTGENCTLSNIKLVDNSTSSDPGTTDPGTDPSTGDDTGNTEDKTDDKQSPDTGIEGVAVVAGLAIVAAGAVVVAKKRK